MVLVLQGAILKIVLGASKDNLTGMIGPCDLRLPIEPCIACVLPVLPVGPQTDL